jgi:hypothetical protein
MDCYDDITTTTHLPARTTLVMDWAAWGARTRLQPMLSTVALNLVRVVAWLAEAHPAKRRAVCCASVLCLRVHEQRHCWVYLNVSRRFECQDVVSRLCHA